MATIFNYNPLQRYDSDLNNLIDLSESAKEPIISPVEDGNDYILAIANKNGIVDFTNIDKKNLIIPDNTEEFSRGDYIILALRGKGNLEIVANNLANITPFGDIQTTLSAGQKYILRNLGANDWSLDIYGGGKGGSTLTVTQPSLQGTITNLSNYINNGDENGIFYYLGTDGNTIPFENIVNNGKITITTNSSISNPQFLVDRIGNTSSFTGGENHYIQIKLEEGKVLFPSLITIELSTQKPLAVEASLDGFSWFRLLDSEATTETGWYWRSLTPNNNLGYYTYFRIIDFSTDGGNWSIREIEFYGELGENYNFQLTTEDKGKLLFFANDQPKILNLDNNLFYNNGDTVYLFLSHQTLELQGNIINTVNNGNILVGVGRLYLLIKTESNWQIILINDNSNSNETNIEVLSGDKILTINDAKIQRLDPNGEDRSVELPPLMPGLKFEIINESDGIYGLIIKEKKGEQTPTALLRLDERTEKVCEATTPLNNNGWYIKPFGGY